MPSALARTIALLGAGLISAGIAACGAAIRHPHTLTTAAAPSANAAPPPAGIGAVQLFHPLGEYTEYVEGILARLRGRLAALDSRLSAGDVSAARADWLAAHVSWLELGQDDGAYGAFGSLGNAIDGTADGDAGATASRSFTGFHRVEDELDERHDLPAATAAARQLSGYVDAITPAEVSADLPLTQVGLDAWVLRGHEILEDALRDTLSQDDDYGSHTALASVTADVAATREMLAVLGGLIAPRAPGLLPRATADLSAVDGAVSAARRSGGGQLAVSALPLRARQRLEASVGAALETLAPVSELMQISNANS